MSTHTHTPGPWRIDGKTRFGDYTIAAGESVRTCEFIAKTQSEANARLIAAAPELLSALKGAASAISRALPFLPADTEAHFSGEWLAEIREAIAKAEGNA
jgi:hypothetical protein